MLQKALWNGAHRSEMYMQENDFTEMKKLLSRGWKSGVSGRAKRAKKMIRPSLLECVLR